MSLLVCISKKSLNYYNQGDSQKGDKFIEMILVHKNKDPTSSSRLYMCFLVNEGTNPGDSDLDKKMTYDYFEKLAEGMKKKTFTVKDESLLSILPKTSYFHIKGGEWDGLLGGGKGTHEFILFPEASKVIASSDFFLNIVTNWTNISKPTVANSNYRKSLDPVNNDIYINNSGLAGILSSGETVGVITQCHEIYDNNGLQVPYSDEKIKDNFIKYSSNELTDWLNEPFLFLPNGWTAIGLIILIVVLIIALKGIMGKMQTGKPSAKASVEGPKVTLEGK